MLRSLSGLFLALGSTTLAQQVGTLTAERHPLITYQTCTAGSGCTAVSGGLTLDANWRWLHTTTGYTNCFTGNTWDTTICPDPRTCAVNCALEGADYSGTYGITTSGNAITLKLSSAAATSNSGVGSRVFLLDTDTKYKLFKPLNREIAFDVNVSNLPCGVNGALYFAQMDADGGLFRFPTNKAGAKYGTGYCDASCPRDLKFINGQANTLGFTPLTPYSGEGLYGSCCNEVDVWESNAYATDLAIHPCAGAPGQTRCSGDDCGPSTDRYGGLCDPDGCDFNPYRQGNTTFYGLGRTVDTSKPFTVVTQFITADGTDTGALSAIKRYYIQNGVVVANSLNKVPGIPAINYINENFCAAQKTVFDETDAFDAQGGLGTITSSFEAGVVLVLSITTDPEGGYLWLDSDYPPTANPTAPGVARGPCPTTPPGSLETIQPAPSVVFSNIKFGPIGCTSEVVPVGGGGSCGAVSASSSVPTTSTAWTKTVPASTSSTSTSTSALPTQSKYGQCGGQGYTGPTVCATGSTCLYSNPYFSQCL